MKNKQRLKVYQRRCYRCDNMFETTTRTSKAVCECCKRGPGCKGWKQ